MAVIGLGRITWRGRKCMAGLSTLGILVYHECIRYDYVEMPIYQW